MDTSSGSVRVMPYPHANKGFCQRILTSCGDNIYLGKRWVCKLIARNPILKTKRDYKIDSIYVNEATSDTIKSWFQKLNVSEIQAILDYNRWNIDKTGIMEGQGINRLVAGSKEKQFV